MLFSGLTGSGKGNYFYHLPKSGVYVMKFRKVTSIFDQEIESSIIL